MKTQSLTKVTLLSIFVMSVVTAVTLNSCQKESIKPKVTSTSPHAKAKNNGFAASSRLFDEVSNLIFSGGKNQKGLWSKVGGMDSSGCVSYVLDTVSKPHTMTYTYTSGCVESDGLIRSGSVVLSYDVEDYRVVNNVYTMTFNNYGVTGYSNGATGSVYNGTVSMLNTGTNSNGNLVLAISANFTVAQDSETLTFSGNNYQYEWIAGESSSPLSNLQFKITGGYSCISTSGDSAVVAVTTPLIKNQKTPGCNFYVQGVLQTTFYIGGGASIETDDYSNPGGCSGKMVVTKNGVSSIQNQ